MFALTQHSIELALTLPSTLRVFRLLSVAFPLIYCNIPCLDMLFHWFALPMHPLHWCGILCLPGTLICCGIPCLAMFPMHFVALSLLDATFVTLLCHVLWHFLPCFGIALCSWLQMHFVPCYSIPLVCYDISCSVMRWHSIPLICVAIAFQPLLYDSHNLQCYFRYLLACFMP